MAKRKTAKPWASVRPSRPRKSAAPRTKADRAEPKPAEPEVPDTVDDLLNQMGVILDKADEVMAARKHAIAFGRHAYALNADALVGLERRLFRLLDPNRDPDNSAVADAIYGRFAAEPGTIPSWSRPGSFLLWIDYVPVRCIWGGLIDPGLVGVAVDANAPWISPSGAVHIASNPTVQVEHKSVEALARSHLLRKTLETSYVSRTKPDQPAFKLHNLNDIGIEAVRREQEKPENAWIEAALKRGPVRPIPLPPHLQTVQLSLLG